MPAPYFPLVIFITCVVPVLSIPPSYVLNVEHDCGGDMNAVSEVRLLTDLKIRLEVECSGRTYVVDSPDKVNYVFDAKYQGDEDVDCLFKQRENSEIYVLLLNVLWSEPKGKIKSKREQFLVTCTLDPYAVNQSQPHDTKDGLLGPYELQGRMGDESTSGVILLITDIEGTPLLTRVAIGRKIRLTATMTPRNSEQGFRAVSCDALAGNMSYAVLRGGCGDGIIFPRSMGFTTDGLTVTSPYFAAFKMRTREQISFQCNFTSCMTNCDGDSCTNERKRRNVPSDAIDRAISVSSSNTMQIESSEEDTDVYLSESSLDNDSNTFENSNSFSLESSSNDLNESYNTPVDDSKPFSDLTPKFTNNVNPESDDSTNTLSKSTSVNLQPQILSRVAQLNGTTVLARPVEDVESDLQPADQNEQPSDVDTNFDMFPTDEIPPIIVSLNVSTRPSNSAKKPDSVIPTSNTLPATSEEQDSADETSFPALVAKSYFSTLMNFNALEDEWSDEVSDSLNSDNSGSKSSGDLDIIPSNDITDHQDIDGSDVFADPFFSMLYDGDEMWNKNQGPSDDGLPSQLLEDHDVVAIGESKPLDVSNTIDDSDITADDTNIPKNRGVPVPNSNDINVSPDANDKSSSDYTNVPKENNEVKADYSVYDSYVDIPSFLYADMSVDMDVPDVFEDEYSDYLNSGAPETVKIDKPLAKVNPMSIHAVADSCQMTDVGLVCRTRSELVRLGKVINPGNFYEILAVVLLLIQTCATVSIIVGLVITNKRYSKSSSNNAKYKPELYV